MKKLSFIIALSVVSVGGHALDISHLHTKMVLLENKTSKDYKINVTLDTEDEAVKLQCLDIKAGGMMRVHDMHNNKIVGLQVVDASEHVTCQGYHPTLDGYLFQVSSSEKSAFSPYVDFEEELSKEDHYDIMMTKPTGEHLRSTPEGLTPAVFMEFLKKLYLKKPLPRLLELEKIPTTKPRIPLVAHHIWFGNTMPKEYEVWREEWQKRHPGWKFIMWDEKKIAQEFRTGLFNQKSFDDAAKAKNYGKMSDIVRYEILYRFGGLYLDCDIKNYKNFDWLHHAYDFYAGLETFEHNCYCCNPIVAAKPAHPIMKRLMDIIKFYEDKTPDLRCWPYKNQAEHQIAVTILTTGPRAFTQAIYDAAGKDGNIDVVMPPQVFFSKPNKATPVSMCCHIYNHAWVRTLHTQEKEIEDKVLSYHRHKDFYLGFEPFRATCQYGPVFVGVRIA